MNPPKPETRDQAHPDPERPFHFADGRFDLDAARRCIAYAKEVGWIREPGDDRPWHWGWR